MDALPRNASGKVVKGEPRRRDITSEGVWDVHALGLEIARDERRAVHPRAVR
jgi:hypothetical protein